MLELLCMNEIYVVEVKFIEDTADCVVIVDGCRNKTDFAVLTRVARSCNGLAVKGRDYSCIFAHKSSLLIC